MRHGSKSQFSQDALDTVMAVPAMTDCGMAAPK
jgi:hypothetical protein